ncbi:MAG TPA: PAS domain-containing protein, partial [Planctomycetota bacterium]|nr:PAS domain-containing protein [Planctomycetota bacterium]
MKQRVLAPSPGKSDAEVLARLSGALEPLLEAIAQGCCELLLQREEAKRYLSGEEGKGLDGREEVLGWLRGVFALEAEGERRARRERFGGFCFRMGLPVQVVVACVGAARQRLAETLRRRLSRSRDELARAVNSLHRALDVELGGILEAYEAHRLRGVEEQRRLLAEAEIDRTRKEAEERFWLLAEATTLGIYDWDIPGDLLWWSEGFYRLFGYEPGTRTSNIAWWKKGIHPKDYPRVVAGIEKAIEEKARFWTDEYRFARGNGTYAWVLDRGYFIRDAEGRASRMVGAMIDLSDRREAEERFRLLAEATSDTIWDWDLVKDTVWWGEGFRRMFGDAPGTSSCISGWWTERIHPDDRAKVAAGLQAVLDQGLRSWTEEYRFRRADGTYADILDRGYTILDESGKPVRMVGAMMDVTERRQAEREIRRQRDFAERILRSSREAIVVVDRELRFTLWNPAAERMSGLKAEEVLDRNVFEVFPFVREMGDQGGLFRALSGEAVSLRRRRFHIPSTGRSGLYDAQLSPLRDEKGEIVGVLSVSRDVTEEERMKETLGRAERFSALGEVAAMIAHEVRNPLTATKGVLQVLLRRLPAESADRTAVSETVERLDALARLITDLLSFSRPIHVQVRPLDAREALRTIAEGLGREEGFRLLSVRF